MLNKITAHCSRLTSRWSWESLRDFRHISNHSLDSITLSLDLNTHLHYKLLAT